MRRFCIALRRTPWDQTLDAFVPQPKSRQGPYVEADRYPRTMRIKPLWIEKF
jgi:hypothetical protein